jgi:hypothetical protein
MGSEGVGIASQSPGVDLLAVLHVLRAPRSTSSVRLG